MHVIVLCCPLFSVLGPLWQCAFFRTTAGRLSVSSRPLIRLQHGAHTGILYASLWSQSGSGHDGNMSRSHQGKATVNPAWTTSAFEQLLYVSCHLKSRVYMFFCLFSMLRYVYLNRMIPWVTGQSRCFDHFPYFGTTL